MSKHYKPSNHVIDIIKEVCIDAIADEEQGTVHQEILNLVGDIQHENDFKSERAFTQGNVIDILKKNDYKIKPDIKVETVAADSDEVSELRKTVERLTALVEGSVKPEATEDTPAPELSHETDKIMGEEIDKLLEESDEKDKAMSEKDKRIAELEALLTEDTPPADTPVAESKSESKPKAPAKKKAKAPAKPKTPATAKV